MIFINQSARKQVGAGMLEVLLVVVIMATIAIASVRQYQKYEIKSKAAQISGTVQVIFDLLTRYYYAECSSTAKFSRSSPGGDPVPVPLQNFVDANLISADALNAAIKDPFHRESTLSLSPYIASIRYMQGTMPNPNPTISASSTPNIIVGYWILSVSFEFPSNVSTDLLKTYASYTKPTDTTGNNPFNWYMTLGGNIKSAGGSLTPISEDLERFAIQQYIPQCSDAQVKDSSSPCYNMKSDQAFSQDYDSSYMPADAQSGSNDSATACELVEQKAVIESLSGDAQKAQEAWFNTRRGYR